MSPEQMQSSKNVDARTDIWALGVVLYELLSGKIPFSGETMTELIVAVLQSKHEPVRATCPNVPAGLETVVDRCLAKDPAARFAHIGELAGALAPFGPPRSEISMERIEQVLAASSLLTPPASPLIVVERAGGVVVSPQEGTAVAHDASTVRHEEPAVQSVVSAVAPRVSTTTSEGLSTEQGSNAFVRRSARRWAVPVAGLAMMAAFGAVGTLAWRSVTSSVDGVGVPSGQAATSAASVGANAARSETPAVAPAPAGPSLSVEPTSSPLPSTTDGTDAGAVATTHPAATQRQPPPIPRSTPPPPKPDCNPPYTVDSTGVKHYKRECTN
jgi:serine/threonine-protein kinase